MNLYRADEPDGWFGYRSFWTPHVAHAERYRTMPGFGGPVIFETTVTRGDGDVLDLRHGPWATLRSLCIERDEYDPGIRNHELFLDLAGVLKAAGFIWVRFLVDGRVEAEEWLYLGDLPLAAVPSR